jgi:hypothetical protein
VVALVLAKPRSNDAVVAEDDFGVMDGHPGDGVWSPAWQWWTRAPGVAAQQGG